MSSDNIFKEDDPFAAIVQDAETSKRARDLATANEIEARKNFLESYRIALKDIVEKEFQRAVDSPSLRTKFDDIMITTRAQDTRELIIMGGRTFRCFLGFEPLPSFTGFRRVFGCIHRIQQQVDVFYENLSERVVRESIELFVQRVLEANPDPKPWQ